MVDENYAHLVGAKRGSAATAEISAMMWELPTCQKLVLIRGVTMFAGCVLAMLAVNGKQLAGAHVEHVQNARAALSRNVERTPVCFRHVQGHSQNPSL